MHLTDPNKRFAQSQVEAILLVLLILTVIYTVVNYGYFESIAAVLLMLTGIAGALAYNTSLDRRRWFVISAGLAGLWIICVPIHALVT